jgi:hypothetical protein
MTFGQRALLRAMMETEHELIVDRGTITDLFPPYDIFEGPIQFPVKVTISPEEQFKKICAEYLFTYTELLDTETRPYRVRSIS